MIVNSKRVLFPKFEPNLVFMDFKFFVDEIIYPLRCLYWHSIYLTTYVPLLLTFDFKKQPKHLHIIKLILQQINKIKTFFSIPLYISTDSVHILHVKNPQLQDTNVCKTNFFFSSPFTCHRSRSHDSTPLPQHSSKSSSRCRPFGPTRAIMRVTLILLGLGGVNVLKS